MAIRETALVGFAASIGTSLQKNEGRASRKEVPDPGPRLTSTWSRSPGL